MEARRIRRLERRRSCRIVGISAAVGTIGVAIGLALPRNMAASALALVAALGTLAAIALRADSVAPSHGVRHVMRLPIRSAAAALASSWWSTVGGTSGRRWRTLPGVTDVDDEDDDEAEAWWGTRLDPDPDIVRLIGSAPRRSTRAEPV